MRQKPLMATSSTINSADDIALGKAAPEGKQPGPHRCNDRLEDVIQSLFEGNLREKVPGPWKLFWQCMKSKPGEEPTDPFFFYKPSKLPLRKAESPFNSTEGDNESTPGS